MRGCVCGGLSVCVCVWRVELSGRVSVVRERELSERDESSERVRERERD